MIVWGSPSCQGCQYPKDKSNILLIIFPATSISKYLHSYNLDELERWYFHACMCSIAVLFFCYISTPSH